MWLTFVVDIRRSHLQCDKPASVEPCHSTRVTYDTDLGWANFDSTQRKVTEWQAETIR
jgi:hypothetical protein